MERVERRIEADVLSRSEPYWIRWVLPSLSDAIFIILFLFLMAAGSDLLGDADTGWHIGVGRYILETGLIPSTGIYSYTATEMPWMAHEWLTELIFAAVHNIFGMNGIVAISALAIAFTHSALFALLVRRGISMALALTITVIVMSVTSSHWLARPHILSMPLTLLWFAALEEYRLSGKRYLYWLPILTILWVNLHGGFMAGLLLVAVYFLGSMLSLYFSKDEEGKKGKKKDVLVYGRVGMLCVFAALINPHGYEALLFPFRIMGQELNVGRINEWASPNFHDILPYEFMLLTLIVVIGFSYIRLSFIEAGLVVLWTHLSLHSVRYGPIFAIILAPLIAVRLENLMREGREAGSRLLGWIHVFSLRLQKTSESMNSHVLPVLAVVVVLSVVMGGGVVSGKPFLTHGFDSKKIPVEAVDFAEKSGVRGRLFNTYHFGGYLIYREFPKDGVFVDGRADMYNEFLKNYFDVVDVKPGWRDVLRKFNIDWMMITANSPLSVVLLETDEWHLIYADKVANIFVRSGSVNDNLIDKYRDVRLVPMDKE